MKKVLLVATIGLLGFSSSTMAKGNPDDEAAKMQNSAIAIAEKTEACEEAVDSYISEDGSNVTVECKTPSGGRIDVIIPVK